MIDIDAIEAAARAATHNGVLSDEEWTDSMSPAFSRVSVHARGYLESVPPQTVLALCAEIRRLRAELAHANATIEQMAEMGKVNGK